MTDTCTSQESGSGTALYSSFVRPTAAAAATSQSICALPMPTCQDIHFFNRLIVTPLLPPRRYSSLAVAVAYCGGLGGRAWAFPGTRSRINLLPLPSRLPSPPSLPVSPNELGRGFVPTSFVKIGRRHSPSPTTAALPRSTANITHGASSLQKVFPDFGGSRLGSSTRLESPPL